MQNYLQLRDAGLVIVALANGSPAVLLQRFDINTGAPLEIEEQAINLNALQSELDSITTRQDDINALISDSQGANLQDIVVVKDTMAANIAAIYSTAIKNITPPISINPVQKVKP